MANKHIVIALSVIIMGFGTLILMPINFISIKLSPYDTIDELIPHEYAAGVPSVGRNLYLDIDIGNIEIKYVYPPINYDAKIDLIIEMAGKGLADRDLSDFFDIIEEINNSSIDFSMKIIAGITESEVNSLIRNISIIVSLRSDLVFNITANVFQGNVKVDVPFNVQINNLNVNTIIGDILFDLKNCILEGNITGIGNHSSIELRTWNIQYLQNSIWNLKNYEGILKFNIFQLIESGANITGFGESVDGIVQMVYNDRTDAVGAWFRMVDYTLWICDENYPDEYDHDDYGFYFNDDLNSGHEITSHDFPARNNYNISLYTGRGGRCAWRWNLNNVPD
ncbi:MAG: hypothetical protein ACXAAI_11205 [Promethearchaeota archaeon]|jgi:hypothetical protein